MDKYGFTFDEDELEKTARDVHGLDDQVRSKKSQARKNKDDSADEPK